MTIRKVPVNDIKPAKYNPRQDLKPGDPAYEKLKRSISEFGYVEPIIWNETTGHIVGGHQRYKVLVAEGYEEVECVVVNLLPEREKALNVALNKVTGDWEYEALADLLKELDEQDFDVTLTGFDAAEIDDLFNQVHDKEAKEDDYDVNKALEEGTFVQRGDLWLLGHHRLFCGDATKAEDLRLLMDGKKANLLLTDPPYNVDFESASGLKIQNDKQDNEAFYQFLFSAFTNMAENMAPGASAYVFHADTEGLNFRKAFIEAGFHLSGVCIWKKNSLVLGRSPYNWIHEPILFGWKKGGKHRWYTGRSETTVWNYDKPKKNSDHPTMKPVPLLCYPIKNSSQVNAIVLDPFGGSGSTLIACEQIDRICFTLELDPKYATVIVKRFIEQVGTDEEVFVLRDGVKTAFADLPKPKAKEDALLA
ncbi:DNA modification methylase [Heliorestis acidaminivorans]|uniref:Methyltransferase n=1 Tax=Heliorestis acidaminivorans TaxID=553427 RepID=A0A6I0F5K0_9FIRM|nr:site-specific DNA-methyltransferase [Heliorestis acidaminivorans]KAB2953947.1 DNA modification methylase [Heliorestis acidaminivorans]